MYIDEPDFQHLVLKKVVLRSQLLSILRTCSSRSLKRLHSETHRTFHCAHLALPAEDSFRLFKEIKARNNRTVFSQFFYFESA